MTQYSAVGIFHHPDGVALPGETVELDPEAAEDGLSSGVLVETPKAPVAPTAPTKE